jgi:hypothetical protein
MFCCRGKAQNNSLFFDGINDYVALPYQASLDFGPTDKFAVEFWFKTTQYYAALVSTWGNNSQYKGIEIRLVSGLIEVDLASIVGWNELRVTSTYAVNDGQWHHLAFIYHGSSATVRCHYFIDGVLQPLMVQNSLTSSFSTGNSLVIGKGYWGGFFGQMDELRIWGTDFCPAAAQARKDNELTGNEPGLLAYYNFNEGVAGGNNVGVTSLPDLSPSGITGTLAGFSYTGATSNWAAGAPVSGTCLVVPGNVPIKVLGGSGGTVCAGNPATLIAYGGPGTNGYAWSGGPSTASFAVSPTIQTVYSVSASGATVCPGGNSVSIAVVPPVVVVAVMPAPICPGQSVELVASGADTYTWNPGAYTGSNVVLYPSASGTYTVYGASQFGCDDQATMFLNIDPGQDMFTVEPPPVCAG